LYSTQSHISCFYTLSHILQLQIFVTANGTYAQPGEESLFTEESRSTPREHTCSQDSSQSSLSSKCLHSIYQPSCILLWITNIPDFMNKSRGRDQIRRSVMTMARTPQSPRSHVTLMKTIWIINSWFFIQVRHAGTSHYALQGLHCQWHIAILILSLHTLCFQIPKIYLQQWHHQCPNAKSHLSSTNYPSLTMHNLPGHWFYPTSLVETIIFQNSRPVVIRMFPNTKKLLLRLRKCSWRQS
jgi:hypothetical protein